MKGFMFDTNIFNCLLDGEINPGTLPDVKIHFTFEQVDELKNTNDIDRKEKLLSYFALCDPLETSIATFVLGNARLDQTQIGGGLLYRKILESLDSKKKKTNNFVDALIAESSYLNGLTLVSDDKKLIETCLEMDIPAISLDQFRGLGR